MAESMSCSLALRPSSIERRPGSGNAVCLFQSLLRCQAENSGDLFSEPPAQHRPLDELDVQIESRCGEQPCGEPDEPILKLGFASRESC